MFCCHMQFPLTTHQCLIILLNQTISKSPAKIGFKTLSWLKVEVKTCRISWSELEKEWNLQGWSTKKLRSLGILFFGLRVFKGCNTLLWKHTCYDLQVFQNIEGKHRIISQVFTKTFLQPPCLFLFWKRSLIYRQSALGAEIPCPVHWSRTSSWTSLK